MKVFGVKHGDQQLFEHPVKEPNEGQVLVRVKTAGLNHRDLKMKERIGSQDQAYILGSDGAGVVETTGEKVSRFQPGDEVVFNPSLNWYDKTDAPPSSFKILDGTFAEYMLISEDFIEAKPSHMSWEEAGVFALSALTGYRALFTQGNLKKGETLFIPGAGGGVTSFIIQMAIAKGARVITTSRDKEKLEKASQLDYDKGLLTSEDWVSALEDEQIDLVIESIGGATFNRSLEVLKKGGRLVTFGSSTDDQFTFNLRQFFYGQYKMIGSTMGSRDEFRELLRFCEDNDLKPILDRGYRLEDIDEAFSYLSSQQQLGKVYITM
ncbi:zinc-binding dehydrogenase [Gracilibacillus caseinilyticus]|uniref:Zinc-binding dehydrogenase n=1 Tax=Gracilibacillus caseinilyticus TaxID=2932256 RepID=A0ABY4EVX9_9BACI|nr:zinc-binding dehydrogenase [Gracilibacillus caseinilyticus]UOQ48033.1 zinc-binding dehydrogenase [Gracilibacillus caseinilyticus]